MKDFSNYKKQPNMLDFSGKVHYNNQLKQEGCFVEVNGEKYFTNEDGSEELYNVIVRNYGIEQKNDLEERSIKYYKKYNINKGDYITYLDDVYLITSKPDKDNKFYNKSKMTYCNNVLTIKSVPYLIPCYADDSSYGQKGVIDSTELTYIDGQIKLLIQDNKYTKAIPLGYRLMFDNDKNSIFEVVKNDIVTTKLIRRIMIKRSDYDKRDDLENNIAYNDKKLELDGYINESEDNKQYKILDTNNYLHNKYCPDGYDGKMRRNYLTKIYVSDLNGNDLVDTVWNIETNIDEINNKYKVIDIVSIGNNFIEIKNIEGSSNIDLDITFSKDNIILPIKIKLDK